MSAYAKHVVAFEPSQIACDRFNANIAANKLDNIKVFPLALGDEDGEAQLGSGLAGNSGSRSLAWTLDQNEMETVKVRRGDSLFRSENLPRLDVMKLDVEGYERRVLTGLTQTLTRDRPVILMELIGQSEKGGFRDVMDLDAVFYPAHRLFTLKGGFTAKLIPFNWANESIVCLPEECIDAFSGIIFE